MSTVAELEGEIEAIYNTLNGSLSVEKYDKRHMVQSLGILTVYTEEEARRIAARLEPLIAGKTVVEIGAGVGLLALEMARVARAVWAVEVDPAWTFAFVRHLLRHKPRNLNWVFGDAMNLIGWLRVDVAVVVSRSGLPALGIIAHQLADKVILPHQEELA